MKNLQYTFWDRVESKKKNFKSIRIELENFQVVPSLVCTGWPTWKLSKVNHYCGTIRNDINFSDAYFLSPRAYILIFGIKKKNFRKKKFHIPPHTNLVSRGFNVSKVNHYCGTNRNDIIFPNAHFLSPRAYILIFGIK